MGPEIAALAAFAEAAAPVVALASAGVSAVGTMEQASAAKQQARAQSEWAERRAVEERASGQQTADEEKRKAHFLQSRLGAVAGASGSGASDPTVMKVWEGIEGEGQRNAGVAMAAAEQKAQGITYQAALDRWKADADGRLAKLSAGGTILGGIGSAVGKYGEQRARSRMAARYGSGVEYNAGGTGYGR